jgi:hypothetical protein
MMIRRKHIWIQNRIDQWGVLQLEDAVEESVEESVSCLNSLVLVYRVHKPSLSLAVDLACAVPEISKENQDVE